MLDQARSGREKSRQATVIKRGRQEIQVGFGKKKKSTEQNVSREEEVVIVDLAM